MRNLYTNNEVDRMIILKMKFNSMDDLAIYEIDKVKI
jgi:hypothetical protein